MALATPARVARLMIVTLLWLLVPAPALAQVSTATIQGTVTDASGVLPGPP